MPRTAIRVLVLCAALAPGMACAEQVAAADVQAATVLLADPDPAVARDGCRGLIKAARAGNLDADARAKVGVAANRRLESAVTIVKAGLADPRVKAAVEE